MLASFWGPAIHVGSHSWHQGLKQNVHWPAEYMSWSLAFIKEHVGFCTTIKIF